MGLMDRVKAQATLAAQKAQEAAQQGKGKLDQAQANRRGDALLRQLGAAVFAERTGRGAPDSQARIDQLVNDITAHEQQNGLNLSADPAQQPGGPAQPTFPPDPASPFPGQQSSEYPGAAPSSAPNPSSTSFPDSGPTIQQGPFFTPPSSTEFPDASPSSSPESGTGQESGGTSAFPPES